VEKNNFLPDFSAIPADILRRAKTLVLNYPNNPTGASATPEFFAQAVEFARAQSRPHSRRRLRRAGFRRQARFRSSPFPALARWPSNCTR
jgi:hypothetical protein